MCGNLASWVAAQEKVGSKWRLKSSLGPVLASRVGGLQAYATTYDQCLYPRNHL